MLDLVVDLVDHLVVCLELEQGHCKDEAKLYGKQRRVVGAISMATRWSHQLPLKYVELWMFVRMSAFRFMLASLPKKGKGTALLFDMVTEK